MYDAVWLRSWIRTVEDTDKCVKDSLYDGSIVGYHLWIQNVLLMAKRKRDLQSQQKSQVALLPQVCTQSLPFSPFAENLRKNTTDNEHMQILSRIILSIIPVLLRMSIGQNITPHIQERGKYQNLQT
jgi:hypothetical protein